MLVKQVIAKLTKRLGLFNHSVVWRIDYRSWGIIVETVRVQNLGQ
jgi:hypothetical protein